MLLVIFENFNTFTFDFVANMVLCMFLIYNTLSIYKYNNLEK